MKKDPKNGFLDFDRDGKTDGTEEYLGYMIMQDVTENDDDRDDGYPDEDDYPR